jgi:hypothetical protein
MGRRGTYPPRVEKDWQYLVLMRQHIQGGASPNAAAVMVAGQHCQSMSSKNYNSCVAWLKRNQRRFRAQLGTLRERLEEATARRDRENPGWRDDPAISFKARMTRNLRELERMVEESKQERLRLRAERQEWIQRNLRGLDRMFDERDREKSGWREDWEGDPEEIREFFSTAAAREREDLKRDDEEAPVLFMRWS